MHFDWMVMTICLFMIKVMTSLAINDIKMLRSTDGNVPQQQQSGTLPRNIVQEVALCITSRNPFQSSHTVLLRAVTSTVN